MEIVSIERKTFEAMVTKFDHFVPDAEHQSPHVTDSAGQRHACLLADKPQDVLPSRRRAAYHLCCGGQAKRSKVQGKNDINLMK